MADVEDLGGLFDGFEGYQTPTDTELAGALRDGVVALDTNVLLDLYRYGEEARHEFFEVLDRVAASLFVPGQVMAEFWRTRVHVLEEVASSSAEVELRKSRATALGIVDRWRSRTRAEAEASACVRAIGNVFDDIEQRMRNIAGRLDGAASIADTSNDPVLRRLEQVVDGKVGRPFNAEEKAQLVAKGIERFTTRTPPGYMDAEKHGQSEEGTGDYLLWEQLIERAVQRKVDILLVTRDSKEDWWRTDKRHGLLGPRIELVDEMRARAGVSFRMLRPEDLLKSAMALLQVSVSDKTIEDASRISTLSDREADEGWTPRTTQLLLERLESSGATVQAGAIRHAALDPGRFVSRQRVFELGGYDENRHLKGFTKPVKGVVEGMVADGEVSEDIEPALTAFYSGPGKAEGFVVPESLAIAVSELEI